MGSESRTLYNSLNFCIRKLGMSCMDGWLGCSVWNGARMEAFLFCG